MLNRRIWLRYRYSSLMNRAILGIMLILGGLTAVGCRSMKNAMLDRKVRRNIRRSVRYCYGLRQGKPKATTGPNEYTDCPRYLKDCKTNMSAQNCVALLEANSIRDVEELMDMIEYEAMKSLK